MITLPQEKLEPQKAQVVIAGIADGCRQCGAALIGGETAEMPSMYDNGEYDLAGFCVGIVEQENLIDGGAIAEGDVIIGLPSSGIHANGFSLVNKIIEMTALSLDEKLGAQTIGEMLLTPTVIYAKLVLELIGKLDIHGLCHITGGGLPENVPRVIPRWLVCKYKFQSMGTGLLYLSGYNKLVKSENEEMYRVFNLRDRHAGCLVKKPGRCCN